MGDINGNEAGVHAEHDAINKLKPLERKNHLETINLLVIRISKHNKLLNSKPCANCIQNMKIFCERRVFAKVEPKCQKDIVWIIWDIFLKESLKHTKIIQKLINALMSLFCLKYTTGCHKKRKNLMYLAISVLCEDFTLEKEIIRHSQIGLVNTIKQKINLVYTQIKKNEESTGTDYLFLGMKSSNLESTIKKLDTMNSFGETFVPRV